MFIFGNNFCCGSNACALRPVNDEDVNCTDLTLYNGIFDNLNITHDTKFALDGSFPDEWDWDTIFYGRFNGNTNAGNVDWTTREVDTLLLKVRKKGNYNWITLQVHPTSQDLTTFKINYNYYLGQSGVEYEFALVATLQGAELPYIYTSEKSEFKRVFIIEPGEVYSSLITDGFIDITRNIPSQNVELLNSRYPVFVRNGMANYETGNFAGEYLPYENEDLCHMIDVATDTDLERTDYQRQVMDFLADGIPKILKSFDGRIWLVQVTPSPTDKASDSYNNRKIDFQWVEVGNTSSEEDLYYLGLSDVEEKWWTT